MVAAGVATETAPGVATGANAGVATGAAAGVAEWTTAGVAAKGGCRGSHRGGCMCRGSHRAGGRSSHVCGRTESLWGINRGSHRDSHKYSNNVHRGSHRGNGRVTNMCSICAWGNHRDTHVATGEVAMHREPKCVAVWVATAGVNTEIPTYSYVGSHRVTKLCVAKWKLKG